MSKFPSWNITAPANTQPCWALGRLKSIKIDFMEGKVNYQVWLLELLCLFSEKEAVDEAFECDK